MRILIADDHPIFRRGLRRILEDYGHEVVAECGHGGEVLARLDALSVDLILMDLQMPEQDGVTVLGALTDSPPVVVLTVSDDDADLKRALDAGAHGYLLKSTQPRDLMRALEAVGNGYRVYPTRLSAQTQLPAGPDSPSLSERQVQVLDGLVHGLTLREIADRLCISPHTVRTYQERLLEKFGVRSRAELISAAPRHTRAASSSRT